MLNQLLVEQETAWRSGSPIPVEELLSRNGLGQDDLKLVLHLIQGEVLLRRRAGENSLHVIEEYVRRFPQFTQQIRELASNREFGRMHPLLSTAGLSLGTQDEVGPIQESQPPGAPGIPDYTLLRKIGEGEFGSVWLGRNRIDGSICAVKVLARRHAVEIEGIKAYRKCAAHHPNLVFIRHVGEADEKGMFFYVMTLADNAATADDLESIEKYMPMTLQAVLCERGALPACEVRDVLRQVLAGLEELHGRGVTHCDVKPDNIMRVGGNWQLGDVGLAVIINDGHSLRGTRGYWPPEQANSPQGDVYAVGLTAWVALTGNSAQEYTPADEPPVKGTPRQKATRRLLRVIETACAADLARRFATAKSMREAVQAIDSQTPTQRRKSLALAGVAVAVLLSLGGWGIKSTMNGTRVGNEKTPYEKKFEPDRLQQFTNRMITAIRNNDWQKALAEAEILEIECTRELGVNDERTVVIRELVTLARELVIHEPQEESAQLQSDISRTFSDEWRTIADEGDIDTAIRGLESALEVRMDFMRQFCPIQLGSRHLELSRWWFEWGIKKESQAESIQAAKQDGAAPERAEAVKRFRKAEEEANRAVETFRIRLAPTADLFQQAAVMLAAAQISQATEVKLRAAEPTIRDVLQCRIARQPPAPWAVAESRQQLVRCLITKAANPRLAPDEKTAREIRSEANEQFKSAETDILSRRGSQDERDQRAWGQLEAIRALMDVK